MLSLKSYEIRQRWLDFWASKGHEIIESASLIPHNDPTLLWINAGVAPLKKYFDGREVPANKRMANAQKSIRTNDIENVGKTARHHTFFEMLGNFSIGDYFRYEVLGWACEVLFDDKWFGLDRDKVYMTYYPDDHDTYNRWIELGVKPDHLVPCEGNFWEIGEGPCGPDTELFFDRGEEYDPNHLGVRMIKDEIENDRYIEIWNIVFSQFNSKVGVPRSQYKELPSKNIDTGMGLERVACIMQGAKTNYETDLFMPIIEATSKMTGVEYTGQMAFKVIADHVRSVVFALSDGATFSNEGRGYVLRRLLRRAIRYGRILGMKKPFLYELVDVCVNNMKIFYPYLLEKEALVIKQVKLEEEKFLTTIETGEKKLTEYIAKNPTSKVVNKETAFLLYDTFGFPIELTEEAASEAGFSVDLEGFKECLNEQRRKARESRNASQSMNVQNADILAYKDDYKFVGYTDLDTDSIIKAIFKDGKRVNEASGDVVASVDKSGFYACSGGQNGDTGLLIIDGKSYEVTDTIKLVNGQAGLLVSMGTDTLSVGDKVRCEVDEEYRFNTAKNHSATHLLNEALRKVVGSHIYQQGSSVTNDALHFDFNNYEPLTNEQILEVEKLVNKEIEASLPVNIYELPIEEAKKLGVQAVFGEKYGKVVRVVDMDFSKELCGGTHVANTSDINKFAILGVVTKGSGVYRCEATTDTFIISKMKQTVANLENDILNTIEKIKGILATAKANNISLDYQEFKLSEILPSYATIINRRRELEEIKEIAKDLEKELNKKLAAANTISMDSFLDKFEKVNGVNVLVQKIDSSDVASIKDLTDRLADKVDNSLILFALISEKIVFICKSKVASLNAGAIVKMAAVEAGGNGGGRPDFAQAGGKDLSKVDSALELVKNYLKENC